MIVVQVDDEVLAALPKTLTSLQLCGSEAIFEDTAVRAVPAHVACT